MQSVRVLAIASAVVLVCAIAPPKPLNGRTPAEAPVNITLFYEGLCLACHHFILNQLQPTYSRLADYITVDLLPFGNAHMKFVNGTVTFECQHGPEECYVNEVQTCAVKYVQPTARLVDFVACMLRHEDPTKAGQPCALQVGTDWPVLDECSKGPEGQQLLYQMGKRTREHEPTIDYVPWVEFNGVHNVTTEVYARDDLFHLLCDMLKPHQPYACKVSERDPGFCFSRY